MAFISFSLTTDEFLSGRKTVTRRRWKPKHLEMWQRLWDTGRLEHDAWDKLPYAGGKKIGRFRLTCRPYLERLVDMPESDLVAEGGMTKTLAEFYRLIGGIPEERMAVVRFEILRKGMLTVGTTAPYGCHGGFHGWNITPQSTQIRPLPQPGDLCVCGARRWPHTTKNPPLRESRTDTSLA